MEQDDIRQSAVRRSRLWQLRVMATISLIWVAPALACGSFAPRPTPTPTLPVATSTEMVTGAALTPNIGGPIVGTATPPAEAATPAPEATPTPAPTPLPGTALAVGQPARVVAPGGLNLRDQPSTAGNLLVQLGTGVRVNILEGPTSADGYTWWRVDDGAGNVGWAAQADPSGTEFLSPQLGEAQPADRSPRVGDRVVVTTGQLTIRAQPSSSAAQITFANQNAQFTVLAGPQSAGGYNWYQIRSDDGSIEGWAAEGDGGTRWLSPLE